MITDLLDGNDIKIYGDGLNIRDWLHVEDHIKAIDMVLKKGDLGETYLVGGMNEDISNIEVAKMVLKILNQSESKIKFVKDRLGHDRRYSVDWSEINQKLGWKPEYKFEEWLTKTIDWYKENEWWWRNLKVEAERFYQQNA
mgnify:FL=1